MKSYMGYSRAFGPHEGAILIIANTAKEARKLAFGNCLNVEDWLDQAATLVSGCLPLGDQEKIQAGIPHVVLEPVHCQHCELWGAGLTVDGLCDNCNEYPGDKLIGLLKEE